VIETRIVYLQFWEGTSATATQSDLDPQLGKWHVIAAVASLIFSIVRSPAFQARQTSAALPRARPGRHGQRQHPLRRFCGTGYGISASLELDLGLVDHLGPLRGFRNNGFSKSLGDVGLAHCQGPQGVP
jgi:hypothetical protein